MIGLTKTYHGIEDVKNQIYGEIEAFYNPKTIHTRVELAKMINDEPERLIEIARTLFCDLRTKCFETLKEDRVFTPELVWTDYVAPSYRIPAFPTIKSQVPSQDKAASIRSAVEAEQRRPKGASQTSANPNGAYGFAIAAAGTIATAMGFALSPISVPLVILGLVAIAGGAITVVNSNSASSGKHSAQPAAPLVDQSEESAFIAALLNGQQSRCKEIVDAFCDNVRTLITKAPKEEETKTR